MRVNKRRRCWWLRPHECCSRPSVGRRHGRRSHSLNRTLSLSFASLRCVVEIFADWCGPSDAVLSTVKNNHVKMMGRKIKWYKANTKEIAALEKYADDAKPRFLFYRDGEVMEAVEGINAPSITRRAAPWLGSGSGFRVRVRVRLRVWVWVRVRNARSCRWVVSSFPSPDYYWRTRRAT